MYIVLSNPVINNVEKPKLNIPIKGKIKNRLHAIFKGKRKDRANKPNILHTERRYFIKHSMLNNQIKKNKTKYMKSYTQDRILR